MTPLDFAHVSLWGKRIGAVTWDGEVGVFEFTEAFLGSGLELSPIRMPLRPGVYRFPELRRTSFLGLPGLLADSLPDRWGSTLLKAQVERQGRTLESLNPVERLCYIGGRGMGALTFEPPEGPDDTGHTIDIDWLADAAARVVSDREGFAAELDDEGLGELLRVGTSAGGARAKALVAWNPETKEIRSGQVDVPAGFEHWIVKFDGTSSSRDEIGDPKGFGRIEYAYHRMATEAEISVEPAILFEDRAGRAHFMTKRFDRGPGNRRHHMLTFSAMGHYDFNEAGRYGYEDALSIIDRLRIGATATTEQYRRMVFNVVARNQDDHTKNISFLMRDDGVWALSPAYDVMWAYNPAGEWTARHQMSIGGKTRGFTREDLVSVGRRYGVKRPEVILDEVIDAVRRWPNFGGETGVPGDFAARIASTHRLDL